MSQHILEPITALPAKPVDVAAIEQELLSMWHEPQGDPDAPGTITRACMSNLIVYSATVDEAATMPEEIAVVVQHHPARVLHLVGEGNTGGAPIEAQVSAFCSLVGGGRHVCSEQITLLAAGGGAARRLPSAVRSLLIGDLPTALWWATRIPPPAGGDVFNELTAMTTQVIYESQGWLDPVRDVIATAHWAAGEQTPDVLADLEWRRLKTWRRLISQAFDPAVLPGALQSITEVRLEHGPHALAKTWMLAGWLAAKLGWQPEGGKVAPGVEIAWKFRSASGPVRIVIHRLPEGSPKVRSGSITWKEGPTPHTLNFVRLGPGRLGIIGEDRTAPPRLQVVPSLSRPELVARQLPDLAPDDLFRETLQVARTMAEALVH
jgi:glucose-6-phosphate dehydrogenase assembly protein OpcA